MYVSALHVVFQNFMLIPGGSDCKESACNAGDVRGAGLISGSGGPPGGGHSNPLQYSCLENPMDGGAMSMVSQSWK